MPVHFPSDLSGTVAGSEIADLQSEHEAATARRHAAAKQRQEAENGQNRARQADAAAYAEAMRGAVRTDPGPRRQKELEVQAEDAVRRMAGEDALIASIERDIASLRRERAESWLDDLESQRGPLLTSTLERLAMLRTGVDDLARLDSIRAWTRTGQPRVPQLAVESVRSPAGQAFTLPRLLDAIRAALQGWTVTPTTPAELPDEE